MFTGNGVTDAVFYHLFSGVKGASLEDLKSKIAMSLLFLSIIISLLIITYKRKSGMNAGVKIQDGFFAIIIVVFFMQSVSAVNLINSIKVLSGGNGVAVARFYKKTDGDLKSKYNYIFIYAESLERTFRDLNGVNYIPNISSIADNYLEFTDVKQVSGTGWTMAGLVNTQCGLPLVLPQGNSAGNISNFLQGADCVASALKKIDYETLFIRGSDKEFAGGDKFLSQHGWSEVQDKNYFEENNITSPSDISGWGVHDDVLLTHAYAEFLRLSQQHSNFLLSFLTVNTHAPSGKFLSECEGNINPDITNEMLKSVACSDYLISQFIKKVEASEYFDKTIIILVSDHYMMENDASRFLNSESESRRNNFVVIKKDITPSKINKTGTLMDVWPTVLDIAGVKKTDIGFGHSLLSKVSSPLISSIENNKSISDYLSFSSQLWGYPSINDSMLYKDGKLTVGGQTYNMPLLATINDNNFIDNVYFDALASSMAKFGSQGKRMLFVETCKTNEHTNACAYILSPKNTEKIIIGSHGIINKWNAKSSIIFTSNFVGFSSAPYYILSGNSIPINSGFTPLGVAFYNYNDKSPENTRFESFDTCNGQEVSAQKIDLLSDHGKVPLLFSSNDSLKCEHSITSFLKITGIPDTVVIKFREQIIGVVYQGKSKYIVGEQNKPLDVFVKTEDYSLYETCAVLGDC